MSDNFRRERRLMEQMLSTFGDNIALFSFCDDNTYVSDKFLRIIENTDLKFNGVEYSHALIDYLLNNSLETVDSENEDDFEHHIGIIDTDDNYLVFHMFISNDECFGYIIDKTTQINNRLRMRETINKVQKKSRTDFLTEIYNRSGFEETVKNQLNSSPESGILCIMDMDNFKGVNDTLGHPTGDKVLKEFAMLMKETFPEGSVMGRIGGDEFVVFLKNDLSKEELSLLLGGFIENVRTFYNKEYPDHKLSASIGAAYAANKAGIYAALYKAADSVLYTVKESGKGHFRIEESTEGI